MTPFLQWHFNADLTPDSKRNKWSDSGIISKQVDRQKKHRLSDIFFITLCAVIWGADDWVTIEEFCKAKENWFTKLLSLQHGVPSHDSFGEVVAIDGKCLSLSVDKASNKEVIFMSWCTGTAK